MIIFPSVTEALQPWADFSKVPPAVLQAAADRGTAVHQACAAYAAALPVFGLPPEVEPYFNSFRRWFDHVVDEVLLCEERLTDEDFGYHGEPDTVVKSKHQEIILVDLKTPVTKTKTWRVQLAAYKNLVEKYKGVKVDRVGSLRLSPEGKTPKMDYYEYQAQDFNIFLSSLNCYRFFNS
jgi:hypothetical protein